MRTCRRTNANPVTHTKARRPRKHSSSFGSGPPTKGGRWTAEEAGGLEQHLLVRIEVASCPIPALNSLGPTVIPADFGNHNGLVLGSIPADRPGGAPVQLACYIDGQRIGKGSAEDLTGRATNRWQAMGLT